MRILTALFLVGLWLVSVSSAQADQAGYNAWKQQFKLEAMEAGISASIYDRALANAPFKSRVIELDRKQPEKKITFAQYMKRVVNTTRINQGRKLYAKHRALLDEIGAKYKVQPRFIVALWGIETNFGGNTGGFDIIPALATLAYEGRRAAFFQDELLKALQIVQDGHIPLNDFQGSWAGAMGQSQFMPSSFLAYAQDYNGDGRKDIWKTLPDVFASIANYLHSSGWNDELTWGREVQLPPRFDVSQASREIKKPLSYWAMLGVTKADGTSLPSSDEIQASIVYPGKTGEESYITYSNYDVIMKWNRSTYFATAVGTLADAIGR